MNEIEALKKEIDQIKKRNASVEGDKAWETSITRKVILIVLTYVLIGLYLTFLEAYRPWLNALVPAAGFLFSTLTLGFIKQYWVKNIYRK